MTKIEVADGKVSMVAMGEVSEIAADLCTAIVSISEQMHKGNKEAGDLFELLMITGLATCFSENMEERKVKGGDE